MRNLLRMQKISEVSLVDRGDNPSAAVLIHKRAPDAPVADPPADPTPEPPTVWKRFVSAIAKMVGSSEEDVAKGWDDATTFSELKTERTIDEAVSEMYDTIWLLSDAVSRTLRDTDSADRESMIRTSVAQFTAAVEAALPKWLLGETVQKADQAGQMSAGRLARLEKARDNLSALIAAEATPTEPKEGDMSDVKKEGGTPAAPVVVTDPADVLKGLPEDVRKMVESLQKQAEDASTRAAAAETVAKAERELRELAEISKRVETEFANLPGVTPVEFAPVLKALRDKAPEEFAKLEPVLKGASEAIRAGDVLKQRGRDVQVSADSAYGQLQTAAAEIRKAQPALSEAQALDLATQQNPALATAYRSEIRGGN